MMIAWQIVAQVCIGLLTVSVSYLAARRGSRDADRRGSREEWWRRFAWAAEAANHEDYILRSSGTALLRALHASPLAGDDERRILVETIWMMTVGGRPAANPQDLPVNSHNQREHNARWLREIDRERASASPELLRFLDETESNIELARASDMLYSHPLIALAHAAQLPVSSVIVVYIATDGDIREEELRGVVALVLPGRRIRIARIDSFAEIRLYCHECG